MRSLAALLLGFLLCACGDDRLFLIEQSSDIGVRVMMPADQLYIRTWVEQRQATPLDDLAVDSGPLDQGVLELGSCVHAPFTDERGRCRE